MRRSFVMSPGTGGQNKDQADHKLLPDESLRCQDGVVREGDLEQIKGWIFDGTTADVADNLVSVGRTKYVLNGNTRTITCDDDGDMFSHNPSSAGTAIFTGTVPYLRRCTFNDEEIHCAQDGTTPLRRYAGATSAGTASDLVGNVIQFSNLITGLTFSANPDIGCYILGSSVEFEGSLKIINRTSSQVALNNVFFAQTGFPVTITIAQTGITFPAVVIYESGSFTSSAGTITGSGTDWTTAGIVAGDGFQWLNLVPTPDRHSMVGITSVTDLDTIAAAVGTISTAQSYKILRQCPFKDAAAHKGSLWGTGVAAYPNRVYVSPPGWDMGAPPGHVLPWSPTVTLEGTAPADFELFVIEVPSPTDGDPNVALLPDSRGMIVLKGRGSHLVQGAYKNFSQQPFLPGVGCIDIRSAKTVSFGRVWASRDGVFLSGDETIENLMEGRQRRGSIQNDWRAMVEGFTPGSGDTCAIGEDGGRMLVSLFTDGGATHVCQQYDRSTGAWTSEVTQHKARYFFSSDIPGEKRKLLWVDGSIHQGRIMDSAPALDGTGIAKNADATVPRLQLDTTKALGEAAGIEGEVTLGDLAIHANVFDVGSAGSTQLEASVVTGGGLRDPADATKVLTTINSDTVDRLDRHDRLVNRSGRLIQVKLDVDTTGTNDVNTKVIVHELALDMFDSGAGT